MIGKDESLREQNNNMNRACAAIFLCVILLLSPVLITPGTATVAQTANADLPGDSDSRAKFSGDAACLACHRDQSASYLHTAHHLTSQLPTPDTMPASLRNGPAVITITDPGLSFKVEAKEDGYYQTATVGTGPDQATRTERIDIITGSGTRGQTYLYWNDDKLFELPISYWSIGHEWINSPGYHDGTARFSRPVIPGCMECHSTYLRPLSPDPVTNRFDRQSLIPGISCETCHGPGADHIAAEQSKLASGTAPGSSSILNPARFTRERQVELCALCHNGTQREALAPAFSYVPGQPLTNYFILVPSDPAEHPDVHGHQVGLLQRSRCYVASKTLTCSTCHDVHAPERPAASYSQRCLGCHRWQSCGVSKRLGQKIVNECIECHMPVEPTKAIVSVTAGKEVRATMRNHWIKIYPKVHLDAPVHSGRLEPDRPSLDRRK